MRVKGRVPSFSIRLNLDYVPDLAEILRCSSVLTVVNLTGITGTRCCHDLCFSDDYILCVNDRVGWHHSTLNPIPSIAFLIWEFHV